MKSVLQNLSPDRLGNALFVLIFCSFIFLLVSCDSRRSWRDSSVTGEESVTSTTSTTNGATRAAAASGSTQAESMENKVVKNHGDVAKIVAKIVEPSHIGQCKKEPYVKYEKESWTSIKKGWAATKAERFGVGFRDAAEYKKWNRTHNTLFKRVSTACLNLNKCAKKHGKHKAKRCAKLATVFRDWQNAVKTFSAKVKSVRVTQPPKLCSITPAAEDPSRCYVALADKIDKVCKTEDCKETSDCWRGISFLDEAIRQAESSCRFVHQTLSRCRSYTHVVSRRAAKFKQCALLNLRIKLDLLPVLFI